MGLGPYIFYLIASMILVFGILTVTSGQIFRAAIYLLFTLLNVAALFFYMNYEFIAAVQVSVYVGGIVVLILFSLFLTQQVDAKLPVYNTKRVIFVVLAGLFGFAFSFRLINNHNFIDKENYGMWASNIETGHSMQELGSRMLNVGDGGYVLPFEAVSVLLLAALIGCITIALKTKQNG